MRRLVMIGAIAAVLVLAGAGAVEAQTVVERPTATTWDHVDYATAASYEGGYFALLVKADNTCDLVAAPAAAPTAVDNLGKPASATGLGLTAPLVAKPIGCYVYRVRGLDKSGLWSDWSDASGPFVTRPAAPRNLVVK